jgi:hypothetical protein
MGLRLLSDCGHRVRVSSLGGTFRLKDQLHFKNVPIGHYLGDETDDSLTVTVEQ